MYQMAALHLRPGGQVAYVMLFVIFVPIMIADYVTKGLVPRLLEAFLLGAVAFLLRVAASASRFTVWTTSLACYEVYCWVVRGQSLVWATD